MRLFTVVLLALALYAAGATAVAIALGRASQHESSRRHGVEKQLAAARSAQARVDAATAALRREFRLETRLLAETAAFARSRSRATTLVARRGTIEWFAQTRQRIAWVLSDRSNPRPGSSDICSAAKDSIGPIQVHLLDLSTSRESTVELRNACVYGLLAEPALALGGADLVAEYDDGVGNTEIDAALQILPLSGGKPSRAEGFSAVIKQDCGETDDPSVTLPPCRSADEGRRASTEQPIPLLAAGDESLLVAYSDCELSDVCMSGGSGIHVVRPLGNLNESSALPRLFDVAGAPEFLAVGGRTTAVVAQDEVVVGRRRRSHVTADIKASGTHRALATSDEIVAILTHRRGADWIDVYDARTGGARGGVDVGHAGDGLAVFGSRVIFSTGTLIRTFDAKTRQMQVIAITAAPPGALSVDGGRVAWIENVHGGARINSVLLTKPLRRQG